MIAFEQNLADQIKDAMRSKDQIRLDCLRAMKSALKYKDVEKEQKGVTEEEAIQIFQSMIKQRKDSADQFTKFGRADDAAKENKEIEVIMSFLPQQLSEAEVKALIKEAIQISGAKAPGDMGKVMKEFKPKITGRADAKIVSELVKQSLIV
jgi:uncharacterized protein YqeY